MPAQALSGQKLGMLSPALSESNTSSDTLPSVTLYLPHQAYSRLESSIENKKSLTDVLLAFFINFSWYCRAYESH